MDVQDYLGTPTEATLPGSDEPIDAKTLRDAQILLCQHAPAVTAGLERIAPLHIRWFEVREPLSFRNEDELAIGNPLPSYRQMIAHLAAINNQSVIGAKVPVLFLQDRDIILSVQLWSTIQWLYATIDDGYVSFTCLPATTRRLAPGTVLLFAA